MAAQHETLLAGQDVEHSHGPVFRSVFAGRGLRIGQGLAVRGKHDATAAMLADAIDFSASRFEHGPLLARDDFPKHQPAGTAAGQHPAVGRKS
jgi:hypothetical protein